MKPEKQFGYQDRKEGGHGYLKVEEKKTQQGVKWLSGGHMTSSLWAWVKRMLMAAVLWIMERVSSERKWPSFCVVWPHQQP